MNTAASDPSMTPATINTLMNIPIVDFLSSGAFFGDLTAITLKQ